MTLIGRANETYHVAIQVVNLSPTWGLEFSENWLNGIILQSQKCEFTIMVHRDSQGRLQFDLFGIIESCDSAGVRKDTFSLNENVYVNGSGFSQSITYDLYVVNDTLWSDGMLIPSSIPGTATTLTSDASGNIPTTAVWNASLTPGKYDVIIDVNGNGKYDADIDILDDNDIEVTAGFIAVPEFSNFALIFSAFLTVSLVAMLTKKKRSPQSNHSTESC